MTGLHISPDLDLPLDAITETFAILAKRGTGKSNAAVVMAEEMYDNGLPWVAIDPKGDWWGVRSAGDGQAPGLAVLVFGGQHGDVPLEPTAGRLVADLIVEQRLTCVLDVSEMTKADQRRFLVEFADRLYRRNTEPLHVFCEEADEYIPQRVMGENAKLVGAFETLVKRGRTHGLGITLITQRSASLNKDVLTQIETLVALRTPSPQDRKAILAWVDVHAAGADAVDALPGLANGEAYVFSPQWLDILQRIRFRRRRTFDSGATPKVGQRVRPPTALAEVDLASIKEAMAATIEKAKADDPRHLRAEVARLTRELAQRPAAQVERVEVPVLTDDTRGLIGLFISHCASIHDQAAEIITTLRDQLARIETPTMQVAPTRAEAIRRGSSAPRRPHQSPGERITPGATDRGKTPAGPAGDAPSGPVGHLSGPQQRIVDALAWLAVVGVEPASRIQVGMVAGYHPRTKGFTNGLGTLSSSGYITYPQPGYVALTPAGATAARPPEVPATSDQLQQLIFGQVGNARARILQELISVYPESITRAELAARLDYHERTKGFTNGLGSLRTLGLLDYPVPGCVVASDLLFLDGGITR